jgi:hypothetical protein
LLTHYCVGAKKKKIFAADCCSKATQISPIGQIVAAALVRT